MNSAIMRTDAPMGYKTRSRLNTAALVNCEVRIQNKQHPLAGSCAWGWSKSSTESSEVFSVEAVRIGRSATDVAFGARSLFRKASLGVHDHKQGDDERYRLRMRECA